LCRWHLLLLARQGCYACLLLTPSCCQHVSCNPVCCQAAGGWLRLQAWAAHGCRLLQALLRQHARGVQPLTAAWLHALAVHVGLLPVLLLFLLLLLHAMLEEGSR
jgi:hypothetical protein